MSAKTISCLFFNDFSQGVEAAVPAVGRVRSELRDLGAVETVMSGSGSAVVGVFAGAAVARRAAAAFTAPDVAYAVRVLRRRPPSTGGRGRGGR